MTLETTIADINVFCEHENQQIREFAVQAVEYHKITQAHLLTETPYWQEAGEPAGWWTNGSLGRIFTSGKPNAAGSYNLTVWINGDGCDRFDVMEHEAAGEAILTDSADICVYLGKLLCEIAQKATPQGEWIIQ